MYNINFYVFRYKALREELISRYYNNSISRYSSITKRYKLLTYKYY